ncbi:DEAD/DEAH box helicase [bacterium]|nr:DEAD/DEAH box helicase [bacterium]
MKLLARSQGPKHGPQTYTNHVSGALCFLEEFAAISLKYASRLPHNSLSQILCLSVLLHDLGKLDVLNQEALCSLNRKKLPVFHEDAGAAFFRSLKGSYLPCAILVYSHHKGLPDFNAEIVRKEMGFRFADTGTKVGFSRTQKYLQKYVKDHLLELGEIESDILGINASVTSLDWRILLSLVVDSDHSDAARHCGQYFCQKLPINAEWEKRLKKLDEKINAKGVGVVGELEITRNQLRSEMYKCCRNSVIDQGMVKCEAPVGSGKTASVLAYLLNQATKAKVQPTRLFVVVPFTSLICQIVDDLREWIVLDGENPEEIVAAHYHTSEYSSDETKHLSVLWRARVIVTTSVQFFETMASNKTTSLRKLHGLPGSMIFIDEFHSCLPLKLWQVAWPWLKSLVNDWNCKIALSSGSISEIWKMVSAPEEEVLSILDLDLRDELLCLEQRRIAYEWLDKPLSIQGLKSEIMNRGEWPKLVIMNTVQNASELALSLKNDVYVIHLSTSLTPLHRKVVVGQVKVRLSAVEKSSKSQDGDNRWVLVATSCVEAGMDFSFKTGFREAFSVSSTLQPAGRVNRNFSSRNSVLYVFTTQGEEFNKHPAADPSILFRCFDEGWFKIKSPAELMQSALMAEWNGKTDQSEASKLWDDDQTLNFKTVNDKFKVIEAETQTVLVSDKIRKRIENYELVSWRDVQLNSVQLWGAKIERLDLPEIRDTGVYYISESEYDYELIGVMKTIRRTSKFMASGGII